MQFVQNIMASYFLRTFTANKNKSSANGKADENGKVKKLMDTGSGDFDYDQMSLVTNTSSLTSISKYSCFPPEKCFYKQEQNTKTLVRSIENEIAESKEDIRYLNNHIYSAEEVFPKRLEAFQYLKNVCKEHVDAVSMEMLKWKRKNERYDTEMKELEQRIGSWQCIIDRAKEAQIQETNFYE